MSSIPRKAHKPCANRRIPDSITTEFIQRIQNLKGWSIKTDYLKDSFLDKFVSDDTDPASVRRQRAINKWLAAEADNAATNDRIVTYPPEYNILPRVRFDSFVEWTRLLIETTIGEVPCYDALIGTFSGGASTSRNRTSSHPAGKYVGKADITERAWCLFEDLLDDIPGWPFDKADLRIVEGNIMFTVPKKTDIDRVACKEPDLNMFMQKGLGGEIRRCLKRVGIDLNDQSRNRDLAYRGSKDGSLATLDLSSASDSVTSSLVYLLMPTCWFTLLDALRCENTWIDNELHRNEMFSSMGNGFTFELESLIFWALSKATAYFTGTSGVISVYGDDIICPTSMAQDLIWILSVFGFQTNRDKSFTEGPFRESCGGHYHSGFDVTPFYLRKPIESLLDIIHMANSLRKWAAQDAYKILDPEVEDIWLWLRDLIPPMYWGGRDVSLKFALVTPDFPRKRLQAINKNVETGLGGYRHWLNLTWTRDRLHEEGVETSFRQIECTVYRARPNRAMVSQLEFLFLSELDDQLVDKRGGNPESG
jgi:hypothetical protein